MSEKSPLYVIAFLDGRLGHEKQTKGVIQALARLTPTDVQYLTIPKPCFKSALLDWATYMMAASILHLKARRGYFSPPSPVDLIIGAGSYIHIPMLLLKRECGAKVVTCMTPNELLIKKIDLCFVPQHDRRKSLPNVFVTVGPPNTAPFLERHDKEKGLILVGGIDEKSHTWHSQDTIAQIESILQIEPEIKWTIATSPRTPQDMDGPLRGLASTHANVKFFVPEDTSSGWIEEQYAENFTVWVTADSISMIYEALTAGCRVGVLPVQWKRKNSKYQRSVDYVLGKKLAVPYEWWRGGKWDVITGGRLDKVLDVPRKF